MSVDRRGSSPSVRIGVVGDVGPTLAAEIAAVMGDFEYSIEPGLRPNVIFAGRDRGRVMRWLGGVGAIVGTSLWRRRRRSSSSSS